MSYVAARRDRRSRCSLPITMLMGGTLTLLIRHRVRDDVETAGGWKIAVLYAVNTAGAAAGRVPHRFRARAALRVCAPPSWSQLS